MRFDILDTTRLTHPPVLARLTFALLLLGSTLTWDEASAQRPAARSQPFPAAALMPRESTGALQFLKDHPDYDGRGVVVAIFDTGVDPAAEGLQTTSIGTPKVIDVIDGTGSGDVAMSELVKPDADALRGATGRMLQIDSRWSNPQGAFRVGYRFAYDLLPGELVGRIKRQRRREFDERQRVLVRKLEEQIEAGTGSGENRDSESGTDPEIPAAELKQRLEQLRNAADMYYDAGPVIACVTFHDGQRWRAVVDADADGNLRDEPVLTDFRHARQFATFGFDSEMSFAVNLYNEGRIVSIVTTEGAHGTHVAGIVAGHYPDAPERNGVAPGAQIVSVKIGDSRLGGMETAAGIERGLQGVLRNRCDLVNMSFGEPTSTPDRGRLITLLSQLVREHGVTFVASAGNSGPALSTVGAPGGTTSAILGIGAHIPASLMESAYSFRSPLPDTAYTWTSRGPVSDGDLGVDLFAPGGAFAPVPTWTERGAMRMHGTSMASPNACGCVALLLSGLKAEQIASTPFSLKRALQNTAVRVANTDVFAQGAGLIQVPSAFERLTASQGGTARDLEISVGVLNRSNARGIYLREPGETEQPFTAAIRLQPEFPRDFPGAAKRSIHLPLEFRCEADWVAHGHFGLMTSQGVQFEAVVDPTELPSGAHYAEIHACDASEPDSAPLARIPITVVKAERLEESTVRRQIALAPAQERRFFWVVPEGASQAELRLKQTAGEAPHTIVAHALQVEPGQTFRRNEHRSYMSVSSMKTAETSFAVIPGRTVEVCLAQYWSSLGDCTLEYEVTFRGVSVDSPVVLGPGAMTAPCRVRSNLADEVLEMSASLDTAQQVLFPASTQIETLSTERDLLFDEEIASQLTLSYEFHQASSGSVKVLFESNDELLYDSRFGGHLWELESEHGRIVATGDIFPKPLRVEKGDYTLRVQLRGPRDSLQTRTAARITLERPLSSSMRLNVYRSRADAQSGNGRVSRFLLPQDASQLLFVAGPSDSQLKQYRGKADTLTGAIRFSSHDSPPHPQQGFPIIAVIPAPAPADETSRNAFEKDKSTAVRKALLERLRNWPVDGSAEAFEDAFREFIQQFPDDLDAWQVRLQWLDTVSHRKERLRQIVDAADEVLQRINEDELARNLGQPGSGRTAERKRAQERLKVLTDALYRKGRALGYMELPDVVAEQPISDPEAHDKAFEETFAELQKWVDTTDAEYVLLHVRRERRKDRYGAALKLLNEQIQRTDDEYWYFKKRRDIYEKLGWEHAYEREWGRVLQMFPERATP